MQNKENLNVSIWSIASLLVIFSFPVATSVIFKVLPNWGLLIKGVLPMIIALYPAAIASIFAYIPLLGKSGAYLCFLVGNISNIRLPCAVNAIEQLDKTSSQDKKHSVSALAISASALTSVIVISAGLLFIYKFGNVFNGLTSKISPIFHQVLPAIFGALSYDFLKKERSSYLIMLAILTIVLMFKGDIGISVLIAVSFILAIGLSYIKYFLEERNGT